MAAPTPTARTSPPGIPLGDGYQTLVTFGADPDVNLWEKQVTPPGLDGGDSVDTTTMINSTYRTMRARNLLSMTEAKMTAAYDPVCYTELEALINVETTVTITFPDGSTLAFYGYLQKLEASEIEEGEQPEAEVTIAVTNWDPVNNVEAGPALASVGSV